MMKKLYKLTMLLIALACSTSLTFGQTPTPPTLGDGTSGNPYQIATLDNLYWLSQTTAAWVINKYFIQTADIDASASSGWDGGAGWTPIGNATTSFAGSYNGQGHIISGLFINRSSTDNIGLFGMTGSSCTIQNLGVANVNITGKNSSGGLVGKNQRTISNCYSTGSVSGASSVGGLVGFSFYATVSNSYNTGSVSGANSVGGLVGNQNRGTISNSYSTGSVTGTGSFYGGFVGYSDHGTVSNCYSTGSVSGTGGGGLVGYNYLASVTNSFWDKETSGYPTTSAGGTGKTTAEMKTLSTFTDAGWDFSTIWSLSSGYNNGYPNLDGEWTILTWTGTSSTAWNTAANWDGVVVPGIGDNVVIPGSLSNYPEIASGVGASCNNLTINSGGQLKVDQGGSLITNGIVTNNGTFAIDLRISVGKWHMVSSPITNATANTFVGDYLQNWDEPSAIWSDITDPATVLATTRGYSLWWVSSKIGHTYTFTGTPNTGNQNAAITYTNHGGTTYDGANLLGNPYPSSIDWSGLDDTYGAVYYWDGSAYVSWNDGSGAGLQYIPPMQGFFVVAGSSGTFNLTNNNRTHSGATSYYKSSGTISNGLVLEATGATYNDELYLKLNEVAASGFELTRDAWKLPGNTPGISQLWSVCPEGNLSIDVRPYQEVVPLGFSNDVAGNYSISIKEMADLTSVILEDTKENTFTDLTKGACDFKWDLTDDENRFKIHLGITGIQNPSQVESVLIYASGQDLYLRPVEGQSNGTLTVTDMAGRSVFQKQVQVSGLTSVPVNLVSGIYLVSFRTNTETIVKKVVIN